MDQAVMFGAGAIGRGLMGQLFTASGYAVTFVDIDAPLVEALDQRGTYPLTLVDNHGERQVQVGPVRAVLSGDSQAVMQALERAALAATAVGARALPAVAPLIAGGLMRRMAAGLEAPLNILVCENMPDSSGVLRGLIEPHLSEEGRAYATTHLGLASVVIGRMVPEPTRAMRERDVTAILAEPYPDIYVDRNGLIGELPQIMGMHAVAPIGRWMARKLYLHNAAHALMGYLGYQRGLEFGYQALEDPIVQPLLASALGEAEGGLATLHGFDVGELIGHVAELWPRLANRALADPVRRLARDPIRKLAPGDRLVGPARAAEAANLSADALAWGIAGALAFDAPGDASAEELQARIAGQGVGPVMLAISEISPQEPLGELVLERYARLRRGEWQA